MAEKVFKYKIQTDGTAVRELMSEVDSLRSKLEKATDPKEVKRLNDQFEKTSDRLKEVDKAAKSIDLGARFEDVYGDIQPLSGRLGELEDRMYELALAGKAGSDEFKVMQVEAANMRKTIIDVDRQVDLLAENKGMSVFSAGLGQVADSFMRLDFESAALQAGNLAKASSQISFGAAIKSLKNLGKTFASLGKALLTNPFFLIVAVVGAIVAAIVKLMDELGILQDIFDAIGDAIGWVIQQFKDLLDWIGLTDYAAEEFAEKQIENNKKLMESTDETTSRVVASLDHRIKMMEAQGKDATKEIRKRLEAERIAADERLRIAIDTSKHIIKLHGPDSDEAKEQMKAIKELEAAAIQSRRDIELFETKQTEKAKARREEELQDQKEKQAKAAEDYREQQREIAEAREDADRMIQEAQINLIEDEMERERQMAIFKENQSFNDIERENLTNEQIEALEIQHEMRLANIEQEFIDKKKEAEDKRKEEREAKQAEEREKEKAHQQELLDQVNSLFEEAELTGQAKIEQQYQKRLTALKAALEDEAITRKQYNDMIVQAEKEKSESMQELDEQVKQSQIEGAFAATSAVLGAIQEGAAEGSAIAKAAAVAQTTIDTYKAAQGAYASLVGIPVVGPALGAAAAAAAVAMGAMNVKKILSTKTPGGGGGSVSGSAPQPSVANTGQPQETPTINFNDNESQEQNAGGAIKRQEKVMVVDYFDIEEKGNEVTQLQQRVMLE